MVSFDCELIAEKIEDFEVLPSDEEDEIEVLLMEEVDRGDLVE